MRLLIIAFILFLPFTGQSGDKKCKVTVKGKVMFTPIYSGGARPTPEVLETCCQPRPMANVKLYLKKNYYSKAQYILMTNDSGYFKKKIRPGIYKVFLKNEFDKIKADEISSGKIDQNQAWRTEPYYVIKAESGKNDFIEMDIRERMNRDEVPRP